MKPLLSDNEKSLFERKKEFLKSIPHDRLANDFPMFIDRQELARYLVRYELFNQILNVKGSIVECGVHRGASLMLFAQLSAILEPYAYCRELIGFDTFDGGFPHVHKKDDPQAKKGFLADTDLGVLQQSIEFFDQNRPIGHIPKITLVKGDAMKTIPSFFKKNQHVIVALLYLDFDLYEATKKALQIIVPMMPKGAVIAFDELNEKRWQGETIALKEVMDISKLEIKKFPFEPHISYVRL